MSVTGTAGQALQQYGGVLASLLQSNSAAAPQPTQQSLNMLCAGDFIQAALQGGALGLTNAHPAAATPPSHLPEQPHQDTQAADPRGARRGDTQRAIDAAEMIQIEAMFSSAQAEGLDLELCMIAAIKALAQHQEDYQMGNWQLRRYAMLSASLGTAIGMLAGEAFQRVGKTRPVLERLQRDRVVRVEFVEHGQTMVTLQPSGLRAWQPFMSGHF